MARLAFVALTLAIGLASAPSAVANHRTTKDDERLMAKVLRESPGMKEALLRGDKYAAARHGMRWVARNVVWTKGPERIDPQPMTPGEIWYEWVRPLRTGVLCGGAATLFMSLMHLWNVEVVALDFRTRTGYTHVVPLVPYSDEGGTRWGILDPTFNLEIVDRRGRTVTLDRIIGLANAGRESALVPRKHGLAERRLLYHGRDSGLPVDLRRCGTRSRSTACGLRWLPRDPLLAGARSGFAAYLDVVVNGTVTGWKVPSELRALYEPRGLVDSSVAR